MIDAYCSRRSYVAGDVVDICVSSDDSKFSIVVTRETGGHEGCLQADGIDGSAQGLPEDVVENGCGWPASYSFTVPESWQSGFYKVHLKASGGEEAEAFFVIRAHKPASSILWVVETNTWNAYNSYGGANTYTSVDQSDPSYRRTSVRPYIGGAPIVSFERPLPKGFLSLPSSAPRAPTVGEVRYDIPYASWSSENNYDFYSGAAGWGQWGSHFAVWLYNKGYSVDVATSGDLEEFPELLSHYKLMISCGHDEYWSWSMRDTVESYIADGGNVAFLCGNLSFWQVRFEKDYSKMVAYKGNVTSDPVMGTKNEHLNTGIWSHHLTGRPENSMSGLSFTRGGYARMGRATPASSGGYTIYRYKHWALMGTGLSYGDQLGASSSLVGYEVDGCAFQMHQGQPVATGEDDTPENFEIIGIAPATIWSHETAPEGMYTPDATSDIELICEQIYGYRTEEAQSSRIYGHATMGTYVSPGGGVVFSAGTTEWIRVLNDDKVSKITENIIEKLSH